RITDVDELDALFRDSIQKDIHRGRADFGHIALGQGAAIEEEGVHSNSFLAHGNDFSATLVAVRIDALGDQPFAQRLGTDRLSVDAQPFQKLLRAGDDGRVALGSLTNQTYSPGFFRWLLR